jgi:hypothetical protein
MIINTWGSKQDLIFKSIKVQRVEKTASTEASAKTAPQTTPETLQAANPATNVQPAP